ncbi:MAG: hypothetical protein HQL94_09510 [Magnetococcales bacterium]|nr:hypothetical protein [Magnetococcales bacterium]
MDGSVRGGATPEYGIHLPAPLVRAGWERRVIPFGCQGRRPSPWQGCAVDFPCDAATHADDVILGLPLTPVDRLAGRHTELEETRKQKLEAAQVRRKQCRNLAGTGFSQVLETP